MCGLHPWRARADSTFQGDNMRLLTATIHPYRPVLQTWVALIESERPNNTGIRFYCDEMLKQLRRRWTSCGASTLHR